MTTTTIHEPTHRVPDGAPSAFVHASALCESNAVGEGTRIWAFAHVLEGAVLGRGCNVGDHAYIEGGVRIGDRVTIKNGAMIFRGVTIEDDAFIGPGVVFTNDRHPRSPRMPEAAGRYEHTENWLVPTFVRSGATVGARVVILPGVEIGAYATVGAGAVVTHSVPPHRLVVGHPATPIGWVCLCGRRIDAPWRCMSCGRTLAPAGNRMRPAN